MPDLEQLREVTDQLRPPPFTAIVEIAHRRQRYRAGVAAAAVVAAVAAAAAIPQLGDTGPAGDDRPTAPSSLTPEEIRSEPRSYVTWDVHGPDADVAARAWMLCTAHCDEWLPLRESRAMYDDRYAMAGALELTTDGFETSLLVADPVDGPINLFGFSEDAFLLHRETHYGESQPPEDAPTFGTYELVRTDGTVSELTLLEAREPEPGSTLVAGFEGLMAVDPDETTIAPVPTATIPIGTESVDLTGGVEWAPFPTWPWGMYGISYGPGGDRQRFWAVWEQPDGSFTSRLLADGDLSMSPALVRREGVMAFVETPGITASTRPVALHLSADHGRSWQRLGVTSDQQVGDLLQPYR